MIQTECSLSVLIIKSNWESTRLNPHCVENMRNSHLTLPFTKPQTRKRNPVFPQILVTQRGCLGGTAVLRTDTRQETLLGCRAISHFQTIFTKGSWEIRPFDQQRGWGALNVSFDFASVPDLRVVTVTFPLIYKSKVRTRLMLLKF